MKIFPTSIITIALLFIVSIFQFSCSKDADLLSEVIIAEDSDSFLVGNLVVDDSYILNGGNSFILNVLSNDNFNEPDNVKIINISNPFSGTATINEDQTITYITNNNTNNNTDTFTYTTETTNEDESSSTEEGTVKIELDYGELKAFPGAEGYGKYTTGGRGGKVIMVTNLKDSGTGSLRAAVEKSEARTIVFSVSGYIDLSTPLRIKNKDITIAGQTSPGDGITLRNHGIEVLTSNVIIRYIRVRPGANSPDALDAIRVIQFEDNNTMENIVLDHCSLSWGKDEVLSFGVNHANNSSLKNITVQNCIVSEGIKNKYAVLVMGNVNRTSFYQNYLAHNKDRQFRASTAVTEFEVINNVIYNFRWGTNLSYGGKFDVINNIYKISDNIEEQSGGAMNYISSNNTPNAKANDGEVYQSGNKVYNSKFSDTNSAFDSNNSSVRVHSDSYISPIATSNLENIVLANVGANVFNDPVDKRVINDYSNSTGNIIDSESEVGGYPTLEVISRSDSYDKDQDGMSDSWELQNKLDPNNPEDGNADFNNDGFSNLEDFLHSLTQN